MYVTPSHQPSPNYIYRPVHRVTTLIELAYFPLHSSSFTQVIYTSGTEKP